MCFQNVTRAVVAAAALILAVFAAPRTARAQEPLDPKAVPEALKPWVAWALDGSEGSACPLLAGHADTPQCAWPSTLELVLDDRGGRFSQRWRIDARGWVPLPGDAKHWPLGATVDGRAGLVVVRAGAPGVELAPGDHAVAGSFVWDSLPDALPVPPATGLLSLAVRGKPVPWPNRDTRGTVWLQKEASQQEGDALEVVVHRKLTDDIPLRLVTRIELHVAGKNREVLLGKALPPGFIPMSLDGPVPARVEPDGRVRVQVRPGIYALLLEARSPGPVASLTRPAPDGPWRTGEEVWVFEAKNDYRVVTVEGVASIDPAQTTLPDAWKSLPAYPLKVGDTLRFVEKLRGDANPPPDQLALTRTLWLDIDGAGYTVSDQVTGTLHRDGRLTMLPPTVLGRVSIGGRDQFITHLGDSDNAGVEVRQGELSIAADSRIVGDRSNIPAVGWAHDFHQVQGTLHLPPGWLLLHASGVDDAAGTWLRRWTLVDFFLALVVAIAIGRLYGRAWGVVALAMLVLTLPEEGAPSWPWLGVLAVEGLLRVLPPGRAAKLFEGARVAALVVMALLVVPFVVQHVREGLHPVLADESVALGAESALDVDAPKDEPSGGAADAKTAPAAAAPARAPSPASSVGSVYRQSNAQVYDPTAIVQTGPGLPAWRWRTIDLRWSGPVAASQRLHMILLSPAENCWLALLRAALLLLVLLRVAPWTGRLLPRRWIAPAAALVLAAAVLAPRAARADVPDKATLDELTKRLTRRPSCSPDCATVERLALDADNAVLRVRMEVDASVASGVPLPGTVDGWSPAHVVVEGRPAALLRTDDGALWVEVPAGRHTIAAEGPLANRDVVPLALHQKPHRVEVTASGWTVRGVHEDGLADDDLELTRDRALRPAGGGTSASSQWDRMPPFVQVERTLAAGLDWQVDTRVVRLSPLGSPVALEVPLLAGESVTTADVRVEAGKAIVHLGPQEQEVAWHSVLDERSPIALVAPQSLAWIEVWRVDVGPVWHASFSGIQLVHPASAAGAGLPEWHPWPGERVEIELTRPEGIAGQTLTIDSSAMTVQPGLRATDVTLEVHLQSSRGGEHAIAIPTDAQLESISVDGKTQPVRQQGTRVTVPIVPGAQTVALAWRQTTSIASWFSAPRVDLGAPSVNAAIIMAVPGDRWLLALGGPPIGPAVLFWSLLLVLVVLSLILGANAGPRPFTPLRWWHWLLLAIGLSQVSIEAGAFFVGWLLLLGWRSRGSPLALGRRRFNLLQIVIVAWTLCALGVLATSLYQGLLGAPEMQVRGNGSSSSSLRWFVDRAANQLPSPWMLSVPLFVYRLAMLAWALWIALALLRWLRWGWEAFTSGDTWRRKPAAPVPVPAPAMSEAPAQPGP